MAESNYRQFLASDIHGAISFAGGFSQFVTRILIPALNESQDSIQIGGNEYSASAAIAFFANFLVSSEENGFRRRYLPNLAGAQPTVTQDLIGRLRVIQPYLKVDPEDSGSRSLTVGKLREVVEIYGEYAAIGEKSGSQDNTETLTQAVQSLSASIEETTQQLEKLIQRVSEPHLKDEDKKLEEIPEEDKDQPADKDNQPVLTAKKERRDKRTEILKTFQKKTTELVRTHKEQNKIDAASLAGKLYSAIEKNEQRNEKIEVILVRLLAPLAKSSGQSDPNQTYLWAQDQIRQLLSLLRTFILALTREFEKLQDEYAKELGKISSTATTATPATQENEGADSEETKDTSKPPVLADINSEQSRRARAHIEEKWLAEIEKIAAALNPPRILELYLALGLGREVSVVTADEAAKQQKAIEGVLATGRQDVRQLRTKYDEAAAKAAAGESYDKAFEPPTAQHFDENLGRVLHAKLIDTWETILKDEKPGQKPSNVPVGAIADAKKLQAEQAAAGTTAPVESEASLSDKIAKISRVQHDMLLVAEGELRLKLKTLGLQDPQIEKIINDNRTLLLDTIRYKAFAMAGDLPADKRAGSSQIVAAVSNEVESFYQKLIVTYSDANAQPQLAGYFAKADGRTTENIRSGLKALGWSEDEIYDVISNLEHSKFAPLVAYARSNGYLSGAAGLANVLVKHNIVTQEGAQALAIRLQNGDIGALIEPMLNQLSVDDKKRVMRDLLRILEKSERGGTLSGEDRALFNKHIRDLLGPQNADAVMSIMSRMTFSDLHRQMTQLYGTLAAADAGANLKGRPSLAGPLVAFAGGASGASSDQGEIEPQGMSDREKFMLEVSLAEAYRRIAEAENRGDNTAAIEVEIALIVHQFTNTGGPKGGVTAKFYADIDDGVGTGGLDDIAQGAGINTDQLAQARKNSYKNRAAGQGGGAADKMAEARVAAKLLRTGGNPAAIAATLLTDAEARKVVIQRLKQLAMYSAVVVGGSFAAPLIAVAAVLNALSQIPIIGGLVSSLGSLLGLGAVGGAGTSTVASGASGVGQAFGRSAVNAGKDLGTYGKTEFARSKPGMSEAARNTVSGATQNATQMVYNINSSMAPGWLAGTAILGPFAMASFFTIIVITVIGGSLGGMPTDNPFFAENRGSVGNLGQAACWPLEGTITTYVHPVDSGRLSSGETAIDIGANVGTPVYSPFGGTAKFLRGNPTDSKGNVCMMRNTNIPTPCGYGIYVRVTSDKGFDAIFGHLSAYSGGAYGETIPVVAGQQIGLSGNSGNSSGPHLHYGILPAPNAGRAPAIYSLLPPLFPATTLSPAAIEAGGPRRFRARFADCVGGKVGQPGSYDLDAPETTTGTTPPATTPPAAAPNVNRTLSPPAAAPTQTQLNDILNTPATGGN